MQNKRYPKIHILSKNELAKHISHKDFSLEKAKDLINDVILNFDKYWKDNKKQSKPEKEKYVRDAKGTPLGKLLDHINKSVLAKYDYMLPEFIFGGVSKKNHVKAATYLIGKKKRRTILKVDIQGFFEQITRERVYKFFVTRAECSHKAASLLADLCTVPKGPKGMEYSEKTIGRGFATSSRLAVWCNLDVFIRLDYLIKKRLKSYDPRIAIYVDDIGITASRVPIKMMESLRDEIHALLENFDKQQPLPVNKTKTQIKSHKDNIEHLGVQLKRNGLSLGIKTQAKINKLKYKINEDKSLSKEEKQKYKNSLRSLLNYQRYIKKK